MELHKFKSDAQEYSKQASELVRQFAFAGIAIIWIFKIDAPKELLQFILLPGNTRILPNALIYPLLCMILVLLFDLLQNYISSIIWARFYRKYEKMNFSGDADVKAPFRYTYPSKILFHSKIVILIMGYSFLIHYLTNRL